MSAPGGCLLPGGGGFVCSQGVYNNLRNFVADDNNTKFFRLLTAAPPTATSVRPGWMETQCGSKVTFCMKTGALSRKTTSCNENQYHRYYDGQEITYHKFSLTTRRVVVHSEGIVNTVHMESKYKL